MTVPVLAPGAQELPPVSQGPGRTQCLSVPFPLLHAIALGPSSVLSAPEDPRWAVGTADSDQRQWRWRDSADISHMGAPDVHTKQLTLAHRP
ncbi:hypothetical protein TREES_T100017663 [Tupaia chinensis]|uniref:Uncharacterized protein n=1 Tax=Tupaia chinensis TaxID=246437 RepID=L9L4C9_TUPCH|nr:hypothetical protein TREES_T100017663 [Tupaia chinensis]